MKKAYPIDAKGNRIGDVQTFSDQQFNTMKNHFGKNFRFVEVPDDAPIKSETTIELISTKRAKRTPKNHEK